MAIDRDEWVSTEPDSDDFSRVLAFLETNAPMAYTSQEVTAELYGQPLTDDNEIDVMRIAAVVGVDLDADDVDLDELSDEEETRISYVITAVQRQLGHIHLILEYLCFDETQPVELGFNAEGTTHYRYET
jgi:hypothetical protein